jgi:pyrrolidone-carboxylate peptidase
MKSTLVYSFRTNKHLDKFKEEGVEVFIFGKLKEDLKKFQDLIERLKPKFIVGLAEIKTQSRLETLAINSFGQKGKVNKVGKDFYYIYTQAQAPFPKSKRPSNSFCNWTMYKIAEIVSTKNTKFSFVHFNRNDLEKVLHFVKNA